jgi:hypothetical protein
MHEEQMVQVFSSVKGMLLAEPGDTGLLGSYDRALRKLGCRTEIWDFDAARARQARLGRIGRFLHGFVVFEPWLKRANRDLVIAVRERRPDFLGVGGAMRVTAGALAQIRASVPSTKLVLFWPDPLQNLETINVQALPLYDLVATYTGSSIDPLLRLGARRVEWLPFAADADLYEGAPPREDASSPYACDVGFIGAYRPEREKAVLALHEAGIHVRVWGPSDWMKRAENKSAALQYWGRRPLYGPEFARGTRASKLALNVIDPTNYPAANMRLFETLACGGTLLASSCPEFADDFPEGIAAFYFDSMDELVAKVRELLPRSDHRKAVADEGRRRVLAGHTYGDRARRLLRLLELGAG